MDINNREYATLLIILTFLGIYLWKANAEIEFKKIFDILTKTKVPLYLFLSVLFYFLGMIGIGKYLGLWKIDFLKNSIIWFVTVGLYTPFKLTKPKDHLKFFKDLLLDNVKFAELIIVVTSVYTFSLTGEIVFLFLSLFFTLLAAVAKINREEKIHKISQRFLIGFNLILVIFTICSLYTNFQEFWQIKTLYEFLTPIVLTALYVPYLFFFALFLTFDEFFTSIIKHTHNKELIKYSKKYIVRNFLCQYNHLPMLRNEFRRSKILTKQGLEESVSKVLRFIKISKNPPDISIFLGWSPFQAKNFLKSQGYIAKLDVLDFDSTWGAYLSNKSITTDILSSKIAFGMEGDKFVAKTLKLRLTMDQENNTESSLYQLYEDSCILYKMSTGESLPEDLLEAILFGSNISVIVGKKEIRVKKYEYRSGFYDVIFSITTL